MRNTGILFFLIGVFVVINSGSFRDLVFGKARLSFVNPKGDVPKINEQGGVGDEPYGPPTTVNTIGGGGGSIKKAG